MLSGAQRSHRLPVARPPQALPGVHRSGARHVPASITADPWAIPRRAAYTAEIHASVVVVPAARQVQSGANGKAAQVAHAGG